MSVVMTAEQVGNLIVPFVVKATRDSVPNVRFSALNILVKLNQEQGEDGKPKLAGSYVGGTIKPSVAELINDPDVDVSQLAGHVAELFDK